MKKTLIFSMVLAMFVLMGFGVSRADSILDYLDFAWVQDDSFGYSADDLLSIKDVTNSNIDVESPVIKKWTRDVTAYIFNLSTSRGNATPVAYWCFYDITSDITSNGNKFRISLDLGDVSLNSSTAYYVYATPVDWVILRWDNGKCTREDVENFFDNGILWRESITNWKDPCIKIDGSIYWEWNYCANHGSENGWSSSSSSTSSTSVYAIRNVSHTYDGKNIKLTWESLWADVDVEIFLWYDSEQTFKKIWTVNSETKSFTFKAVHNWDHILKLNLEDPYQDINYTAHYLETENPEVKPVEPDVKPVVVWPKENIMLILFWTLILYVVYRIAARKRS